MTDTNNAPQPRSKRGLDPVAAAELADLLVELSDNPETRRDLAKAIKKAAPNSPHAKAFKDIEVEDRFEEFERKQEEKRIKDQQDAVMARMNAQRQGLLEGKAGRQYSADDLGKIEELMQKKGITDYDDGAVLYAATLPPETPKPPPNMTPPGANWELPDLGKYAASPWKAGREEAHSIIGEFMRKRA